jgi:pSer/pThr/pTyr-binding forkhead associated (FHA) protein
MQNLVSPISLNVRAQNFLDCHPDLSRSLLADCATDLNRVVTIIEPALDADQRFAATTLYIQAITTGRTAFLTTNVSNEPVSNAQSPQVSGIGSTWLIGRNASCELMIPRSAVSRCHAVVGFVASQGFYIMDLGSKNGTSVNRRRLVPRKQRFLRDGDLIEISRMEIEFFIAGDDLNATALDSTHSGED